MTHPPGSPGDPGTGGGSSTGPGRQAAGWPGGDPPIDSEPTPQPPPPRRGQLAALDAVSSRLAPLTRRMDATWRLVERHLRAYAATGARGVTVGPAGESGPAR